MKRTKECQECGCELTYCEECKAYHHTDSFKQEHLEFQEGLKTFRTSRGHLDFQED